MTANVHEVEFSQELLNLNNTEALLAASEMEATNQDNDNPLKTLRSRLIVGTSSTTVDPNETFSLTTANAAQIHRPSMHHGLTTKIGMHSAPSGLSTGTYYVNRVIWTDIPFNGDPCILDQGETCSPIACNCQSSQCDVINNSQGRLSILRFTPLAQLHCTGDVAPWPDGNAEVNVNDLLAVINGWGPCADPDDCPGDATDNGTIDVDDLLAVINQWGDCATNQGSFPPSLSACFNEYCSGLTGAEYTECVNKCAESYCSQVPTPEDCQ